MNTRTNVRAGGKPRNNHNETIPIAPPTTALKWQNRRDLGIDSP
jgi:hypothetical protein